MQAFVDVLFSGADRFKQLLLATRDEIEAADLHVKFITRSPVVIVEPDDVEFSSAAPTVLITAEDLNDGSFIAYGPEHVAQLRIDDDGNPLPSGLFQAAVAAGFRFATSPENN
jgi:hypothetical protein